MQLLSSAASDYDHGHGPMRAKRQVYQREVIDYNYDSYEDNHPVYDFFDIDTPVETIQAYASNFRPNQNKNDHNSHVRMPKDKW
jgi:hypothetical protein